MKYLFLDDVRVPKDVTWVLIGTGKSYNEGISAPWEIVRSYKDAIKWVEKNGFPDVISFDHDLGYSGVSFSNGIAVVTDSHEERSGYDFAKWLIEYDLDTNTMPKDFKFTVHSMNPVGVKNITNLLENYMYQKGIG